MNKVEYFISLNGDNPIDQFLNSLLQSQQAKLLSIFETFRKYGLSSIIPHVKKLAGTPLWEIRVLGRDNIRALYVTKTREKIIILHGFIKKSQKTDRKEINTALRRYSEILRRE